MKKKVSIQNIDLSILLLGFFLIIAPFDIALGSQMGTFLNIFMLAMFVINCFEIFILNKKIYFKKLSVWILIYILYMTVTILYGPKSKIKSSIFPCVVALAMFPYYLKHYAQTEVKYLSKCINVFSIILLIVIIYNKYMHTQEISDSRLYVYLGNYADPNYFTAGIIFIVMYHLHSFMKYNKVINFFLLISTMYVVFLCESRGGLLAIIASIGIYIIFNSKKMILSLLLGICILLIIYLIALKVLPEYMVDRIRIESLIGGTGSGRTIIWGNFFKIYNEGSIFNKIFGFGRGSCSLLYFNYTKKTYYLPHNMYIKTLIEGGITGELLLILPCIISIKKCFKEANVLGLSIIVGFYFSAFFLDMDDTRTMWIIWLFAFINNEKSAKLIKMLEGKSLNGKRYNTNI